MYEQTDDHCRSKIPDGWRAPFELSFRHSLKHVVALSGLEVDRHLAREDALAQVVDRETILLSSRLAILPPAMRLLVIGHELAHAVQVGRGGSDAPRCLEAEAWAAARAALCGQPFEVRGGGCGGLQAAALVLDQAAQNYFLTFPQFGSLHINNVQLVQPLHFSRLLSMMLASGERDFVLDIHGWTDNLDGSVGLRMPLHPATGVRCNRRTLRILSYIGHLQQLMRQAESAAEEPPAEGFIGRLRQARQQSPLERWNQILEIVRRQKARLPTADQTSPDGRCTDVAEARRRIELWLDILSGELFPAGNLAQKRARAQSLVNQMGQLRSQNIHQIQFRACRLGSDRQTLYEFREFFEAQSVCGPDVRSFFTSPGLGRGDVGRQPVDNLLRRHPPPATQLFQMPGGRFAIWLRVQGSRVSGKIVADSYQAAREWIDAHLMLNSGYQRGAFRVHFLQTEPPSFPRDPRYREHIHCSSHIWYTQPPEPREEGTPFWEEMTTH